MQLQCVKGFTGEGPRCSWRAEPNYAYCLKHLAEFRSREEEPLKVEDLINEN